MKKVHLNVVTPYDFALCLRAIRCFGSPQVEEPNALRLATRIQGIPTLIEISRELDNKILASYAGEARRSQVREIAEWVLFAELDLTPFYRLTAGDRRLETVIQKLHGLKPMRPASLFEMAITAITEQQISMAAAYKIRSRIVQRFGESIANEWIFPEPSTISAATLEDLRSCGLSGQKAQYIRNLAVNIASGTLDLDQLTKMDDNRARDTIMNLRGFGQWSADYILVRGLARPDCVPTGDLGIRSVVGKYLGNGQRISSSEVADNLEPFRQFRGLLAFYLLVAYRLKLESNG